MIQLNVWLRKVLLGSPGGVSTNAGQSDSFRGCNFQFTVGRKGLGNPIQKLTVLLAKGALTAASEVG